MPRALRVEYAGATYHVMCRGNRGAEVFGSAADGELWLRTLEEVIRRNGWRLHAWVLMNTHYHLLLETPEANLVNGMKWFQGTFTKRLNAMQNTWGHVYQGRYKAKLIDDGDTSYFGHVADYIHLNPVAAGLVKDRQPLEAYEWSSYPDFLKAPSRRLGWLSTQRVLSTSGIPRDTPKGRSAYQAHMNLMKIECQTRLARENGLKDWMRFERGWVHGSESFRERMSEAIAEGRTTPAVRLEDADQRRDHAETGAKKFIRTGLKALELSDADLNRMRKNDPKKKLLAGYVKINYGVSNGWISEHLKMGDRAEVSRSAAFYRKPPREFASIKKTLAALKRS